jgi:hypothetical protein
MLNALRAIGVRTTTQAEEDELQAHQRAYERGDHIENLPPTQERNQRQRLVHFDIDPGNSMFLPASY